MKAFSDISAECYMRFAPYFNMIMVCMIHKNIMYHLRHMSWLTFIKNLTNIFIFMYILPGSEKKDIRKLSSIP